MVLDGEPAMRSSSKWAALGGNLWMGDISKNTRGKRVQDVKITGIENARIAIRMCPIKQKRIMSDAQAAHAKTAFGESP
jgi:hypothetical protein